MRLGPLTLASNLFLAPLAGYTNLPFRLTVRELGGLGLATICGAGANGCATVVRVDA